MFSQQPRSRPGEGHPDGNYGMGWTPTGKEGPLADHQRGSQVPVRRTTRTVAGYCFGWYISYVNGDKALTISLEKLRHEYINEQGVNYFFLP